MSDLSNIDPSIKLFLEKLDNNKEYTLVELSKIAFTLSQKKGRNKKVKDPNAPPKEKSEYQKFVAEQSPIIKAMDENKDKKQTDILRIVAKLWKEKKGTATPSPSSSDSEEEQKSSSSLSVEPKPVETEAKPEKKTRARKNKE
jgi:hypothetical protein